ncbi:MAG: prolipoprotein diacylglyceryl transferase [Syntrophomonadaceae bacterium]|nr:prolipoprotein diacylglyceryl transferase [Syntrophomonadaceae bacterium]
MKEVLSFGHIHIYLFGITVAVGMLAGILLASKEAKRLGVSEDPFFDVVIFAVIGGIIGARLVHVLVYEPSYYLANPLEIIYINNGGLSIHGGILGGVLFALWRIKKHRLSLWQIADIIAPALILGQAIGRIGCDIFGVPMIGAYPWGVNVNGTLVHPAQVYEFILDYLLFAYLWSKRYSIRYQGQIFVHYLVAFSIIRGFVEYFRTDPTIFGFVSVSYLLSFAGIVAGLILHQYLKKRYPLEQISHAKALPAIYTYLITLIMIIVSVVIYYLVQG